MSLFARIEPNATNKIAVHRFGAALREWASGGLTRQQIIDGFALAPDEVAELDALQATYNGMSSNNLSNGMTKVAYLNRMEDVFLLIETGDYNEAKAKNRLGF